MGRLLHSEPGGEVCEAVVAGVLDRVRQPVSCQHLPTHPSLLHSPEKAWKDRGKKRHILLQDYRPTHSINSSKLPIAHSNVIKLIRVLRLHEQHRLLQFIEILLQNWGIFKGIDEIRQVLDIFRQRSYTIGINLLYIRVQGEGEDEVRGMGEGVEVDQFFDLAREAEQCGCHDVGEVLGQG
jgi:hypothetical protein